MKPTKLAIMKFKIFFLGLLFSLSTFADTKLRIGDIILQPLNCWACSLIEGEEQTIYSHMGIVIATTPEVLVAEAFMKVRSVSLSEFLSKTERGQQNKVKRFRNERVTLDLEKSSKQWMRFFEMNFLGKKYDEDFLWNNVDSEGEEKLYCSEFVAKYISGFLGVETPIKRMHFSRYPEHWKTYFRGRVPEGLWGNSPADFDKSELFYDVGEL